MEQENLFDTEEKRERCALALSQLTESEGWSIIKALMRANIDEFSEKILDDNDIPDKERRDLIVRRSYMRMLADWPERLIGKLREEAAPKESFDPYYQSKNDNK
jgi:hypothetical protein